MLNITDQNIQLGSSQLSKKSKEKLFNRVQYMVENMRDNLAYLEHLKLNELNDKNGKILDSFKKR